MKKYGKWHAYYFTYVYIIWCMVPKPISSTHKKNEKEREREKIYLFADIYVP